MNCYDGFILNNEEGLSYAKSFFNLEIQVETALMVQSSITKTRDLGFYG